MTGSSGGFTVVPSELQTHANTITQLTSDAGSTVNTAQQAVLGGQAFGEIAVALAFANILKSVAQPGVSALSQAQSMLSTISRTINVTTTNYHNTDQSNASRFQPSVTGTTSMASTGLLSPTGTTTSATKAGNNGASILTDVTSLEKDISSGSWIQAGLAGMKVVSDVGQIMANPVGAVTSFGLNFLVQHVKPLQDAVGWLVGTPGQVSSYGSSWLSIGQSVGNISNSLSSTVRKDTANWTGAAADSYRSVATDKVNTLNALAAATKTIGSATQVIGQLVAKVRGMIQDMVSKAMQQIIQTALSASFMITIPVVVAEVVGQVVSWMSKIADVIKQLTSAFSTLQPLMGTLQQLFSLANKSMSSGIQPLSTISPAAVPGITMPTPTGRTAPIPI
jgi:uncharacterized protein YukE